MAIRMTCPIATDDLAERLHLRDVEGDHRHLCIECRRHRLGRCGNHKVAGLLSPGVGPDLATLLHVCMGFERAER